MMTHSRDSIEVYLLRLKRLSPFCALHESNMANTFSQVSTLPHECRCNDGSKIDQKPEPPKRASRMKTLHHNPSAILENEDNPSKPLRVLQE
jgi:hypothetical protein